MQSAIDALSCVAVHCRGVIKSYGAGEATVTALRGVDLDVRAGELLMVVGPSGCGKTTLVSVIAGILDQDAGECEVLGHALKTMGRTEKTRFRGQSIGFVFQMFNLLPALTAIENVSVPLLINGASRAEAGARAKCDPAAAASDRSRTHAPSSCRRAWRASSRLRPGAAARAARVRCRDTR